MIKKIDDLLDYVVDFSLWLSGDTVIDVDFSVKTSTGLVIENETNTDTTATVWLSGGNKGRQSINCQITTAQGRIKNQPLIVEIIE